MFAAPFSISCAVSYLFFPVFAIQCSLFNVRYSMFAIQCSPRHSPFAAPFPIHFLWKVSGDIEKRQRMVWKASGNIEKQQRMRTARRIEVRYSIFATPFSIRCAVSYLFVPMFSIQGSLFNVRRAIRRAVRHSPIAEPFAAPFAVAFQCPLTLSIEWLGERRGEH